jgi:PAS domain S-box-containing protein
MDTRTASAENQPHRYRLSANLPDRRFSSSDPTEEDKFRTLAENLPQMIFACDANGRKNYCCQRYLDYTGCSSFEEVDRRWLTIIHPEDQKAAINAWAQALEKKTTYLAEYRMRRHDGVYRHHLARAIPTVNRDGQVSGWVGTITDIDEEKGIEERLRRTEKLAAAGRMAASLAHEINNPLASVTNAIFLALQDPSLTDTTRQYLKIADRELQRVAQVTVHSLRFHQQSAGPRSESLSDIMNSVLAIYLARLQALSIDLVRDYRTSEKLHCRVDDMRQTFSHLISNAIDAMSQGGSLRIRVRLSHAWDGSGTSGFRVVVADTGAGIAQEFLPRVFDAFATTKNPTGTGLGLWVVDEIIRKHKGRISIRSSVDARRHGTVVSIFLPFLGAAY